MVNEVVKQIQQIAEFCLENPDDYPLPEGGKETLIAALSKPETMAALARAMTKGLEDMVYFAVQEIVIDPKKMQDIEALGEVEWAFTVQTYQI